jgi:hypothetical protein
MKLRRTVLALFCVTLLGVGEVLGPGQGLHAATLAEAVAKGQVTARLAGRGSCSGDAILLTIAKTPKAPPGPLALTVEPGTLLRSSNASEQNMVVASVRGRMVDERRFAVEPRIVVRDGPPATYVLEAYCADFEKKNPSPTTRFAIARPHAALARVIRHAQARRASVRILQAAIWIVTDRVNYDELNQRFRTSRKDWQEAMAILRAAKRGEEPPERQPELPEPVPQPAPQQPQRPVRPQPPAPDPKRPPQAEEPKPQGPTLSEDQARQLLDWLVARGGVKATYTAPPGAPAAAMPRVAVLRKRVRAMDVMAQFGRPASTGKGVLVSTQDAPDGPTTCRIWDYGPVRLAIRSSVVREVATRLPLPK